MYYLNKIKNVLVPSKNNKPPIKLLILGLDNSGKTTILNSFDCESFTDSSPTKGFYHKNFTYDSKVFSGIEIGGQCELRKFWSNYYGNDINCIIFVIDASDGDRLFEANTELCNVLTEEKLLGVPLLILLNKIDKNDVLTTSEITINMEIYNIKNRVIEILEVSALTKKGIYNSLDWISKNCDNNQ